MDRRTFLRWTGLGGIALFTPRLVLWPRVAAAAGELPAAEGRVLVLVELKGGNDGLNTVIPYADEAYRRLRPRLAVPRDAVLTLDETLGLHGKLRPLLAGWEARDLAIVNGVGYPRPNRSHFRSIEIWETGSASDEFLGEGWIARLLGQAPRPATRAAEGIVLGGEVGPLAGPQIRTVAFRDPGQFARQARRLRPLEGDTHNRALAHLLRVREDLQEAARVIAEKHARAPSQAERFPRTDLGRQLQTTAELITSQVPVAVVKTSLGGFDTHANQQPTHERLLGELAEALAAFRAALLAAGLWDRVLVMTYSEFGRRAAENGSGGTDHGTAAPHFLAGGCVQGGFHGAQPPLAQLQSQDLVHTIDYRQLYATVATHWWGLPTDPTDPALRLDHPALPLIRTATPMGHGRRSERL